MQPRELNPSIQHRSESKESCLGKKRNIVQTAAGADNELGNKVLDDVKPPLREPKPPERRKV